MILLRYNLEGGIRADTLLDYLKRHYDCEFLPSPFDSIDSVKKYLALPFNEQFIRPLLQNMVILERIAYEAVLDLYEDNVSQVLFYFNPYLYAEEFFMSKRQAIDAVINGIIRGEQDLNNKMNVQLVLCADRNKDIADLEDDVHLVRQYKQTPLKFINFYESEDTPLFVNYDVFSLTRQLEIPFFVELNYPKSATDIEMVLSLGCKIIKCNYDISESDEVIDCMKLNHCIYLAAPSSEKLTGESKSLLNHQIKKLHENGVLVLPYSTNTNKIKASQEFLMYRDILNLSYTEINNIQVDAVHYLNQN